MSVQHEVSSPVAFGPRRIGHVNLFVDDVPASEHFYHKVCGFEPVYHELAIRMTLLSNGNSHHDVAVMATTQQELVGKGGHVQIPKGRGVQPGLNHFAWEVESEQHLVDAYNRALAAKLELHRTVDHTVSHSIYVFDPDGHLHEFYADVIEDWRKIYDGDRAGPAVTGQWNPNDQSADDRALYPSGDDIRMVSDAAVHPTRLSHAVLRTGDHAAMTRFCENVAGFETVYRSKDGGVVCYRGTNGCYHFDLALVRQKDASEPAIHHYSFAVLDETELSAAEARLEAKGIEIERRVDNAAKRSFFLIDPDGLRCEFFVRRDGGFPALDGTETDISYLL
ncbi:MAG: VOC family protein [Proteobacteria bacterium]|nr:VOC family protein [Pseudomonadota bacterium]